MSAQFDALLDFDDLSPSTNGTTQQTNGGDDLDLLGSLDTTSSKGGAGGDDGLLLDFSVTPNVSSAAENGVSDPFEGQFSLNSNTTDTNFNTTASTNPFSDMSTTETQSSNPLYDLMDDDLNQTTDDSSVNPLYSMSTETTTAGDFTFDSNLTTDTTATTDDNQSANPLYDLMDAGEGELSLEVSKTEETAPSASNDLLDMDFGSGTAMEKSTPAEEIEVQASTKYEEDQLVPDIAPAQESGPRESSPEEEEGEAFDQNVELFIREEGEDQVAVAAAATADDVVGYEEDMVPQQQQQQEEIVEEQQQEIVEEQQQQQQEIVEEQQQQQEIVEEQQEEEAVVEEEKPETLKPRSRSPSLHSISSEGEVLNESSQVTFQSSKTISLSSAQSPSLSVSSTSTNSTHSTAPPTQHVGRSVALLRLSRGQTAQRTKIINSSRHEEDQRRDERAVLEQEQRDLLDTRSEEQQEQLVDSGFGGAVQKEDNGPEQEEIVTEDREEIQFQSTSTVKDQFERASRESTPQRQQPVGIKQEVSTADSRVSESQPAASEPQWEEEPEEGVFENEPEKRQDVARESDRNIGDELPSVGTAKSMRDKFAKGEVEKASVPMKKESTPPAVVEGGVYESEPQYNPDVVHSGEDTQEDVRPEEGTARNLAARFKELEKQGSVPVPSPGKREITPDRTGKVEYVSEPRGHVEKYEPEVQAGVFESKPADRADVVKSEDQVEEVLPEKGLAKNIAARFKQMSTTDSGSNVPRGKRELTPDTSGKVEYVSEPTGFIEQYEGHTESGVFESEPAGREDVVKSDDTREDVLPERGTAKKFVERFKEMEKTSKSPPSPTKQKEFTPPRENGTSPTSAGVYESTPKVATDVVHSDDHVEEVLPEKGMAKNIANRFRQLSSGDNTPLKSPRAKKEFTPPPGEAGIYENTPKQFVPDYNRPAESGILESKPETRDDVVKSGEPNQTGQELPEQGYTKNLLSAWRQKESEGSRNSPPSSGKPKEFTPPREEPRVAKQRPAPRTPKSPQPGANDGSVHPTDLPGQYQPQTEASVFESEPEHREDVVREDDTDWNQGMPKADTTKKMLAKFRNIQQQANSNESTPVKPKPATRKEGEDRNSRETTPDQVGRSKSMRAPVQLEKCGACQKTVYVMEKIEIEKHSYHKGCFRCSHCKCVLTPKTFAINKNVMFCTNHYKQLFATKGNYDEGFGRDQHKKRWKSEPNLADGEDTQ